MSADSITGSIYHYALSNSEILIDKNMMMLIFICKLYRKNDVLKDIWGGLGEFLFWL